MVDEEAQVSAVRGSCFLLPACLSTGTSPRVEKRLIIFRLTLDQVIGLVLVPWCPDLTFRLQRYGLVAVKSVSVGTQPALIASTPRL